MNRVTPCRQVVVNAFALTLVLIGQVNQPGNTTDAGEVAFVSGFERFARHDQIDSVQAGRLLISELSCTHCHHSDEASLISKGGPSLRNVGLRLRPAWVREYIAHPSVAHPGTTMPDAMSGTSAQKRQATAADMAAFLSTQRKAFPLIKATGAMPVPSEFWQRGNVETGRMLYHTIGCVACHEPDASFEISSAPVSSLDKLIGKLDADELEDLGLTDAVRPVASVPQSNLAAKYTTRGLTQFLLNPHDVRPGGRMPDLKLMPVEAADLASYLISRDEAKPSAFQQPDQPGDAASGRLAFEQFRCVRCHQVGGLDDDMAKSDLPRLNDLRVDEPAGCLQPGHLSGPSFSLDDFQRNAILAAIRSSKSDGSPVNDGTNQPGKVTRQLQHRLLQMNCYACHVRDDLGGVGRQRKAYFQTVNDIDLGDEGRLPPPLTGAGHKIKPAWFAKVLAGNKADIRHHMTIRMPRYHPDQVKPLPKWFADSDRPSKTQPAVHRNSNSHPELIRVGRKLMDIGCVQCHAFGGFTMPGVVGVDLSGVTDRVNQDWFHAFLRDPGALKSRTRMPNFFADGKAQNKEWLGGDPDQQIAAMWAYLKDIPKHGLPEKIQESRSQTYELVPKERPVLLRTFMPNAGLHAIAVGFPEGVHFAFDAERVRLATAWRGKFLDAQGTWFIRFAPPAKPLGTLPIEFAPVDVFANTDEDASDLRDVSYRFGGYRLDTRGIPTFLYRFGDLEMEDRIMADQAGNLQRTWRVKPGNHSPQRIAFTPLAGRKIRAIGEGRFVNEDGLQVHVKRLPEDAATIMTKPPPREKTKPHEATGQAAVSDPSSADHQRLVYWIDVTSPLILEVDYSW